MAGFFQSAVLGMVTMALLVGSEAWGGKPKPAPSPSPSPSATPSPTPSPTPLPSYQTLVPHEEVRSTLNGLLDDSAALEARGAGSQVDPSVPGDVIKLLGSYRTAGAAGSTAIKDGPYFDFLIGELNESYATEYASYYQSTYQEDVTALLNLDLVSLFNKAMDMIAAHQAWEAAVKADCKGKSPCPAAGDEPTTFSVLQQAESELGTCLVARVRSEANDASCVLDADPNDPAKKPNLLSEFWLKLSCDFHGESACSVRQEVYDLFKPQLIALKQPGGAGQSEIAQAFQEAFPAAFRAEYLAAIAQEEGQVPGLLSQKFGATGQSTALFEPTTALIDLDAPETKQLTMQAFADGMRADMGAAARLEAVQGADADVAHTMAAALFYASANRLLLLVGIQGPEWDGKEIVVAPGDELNPKDPTQAPNLVQRTFGGYGIGAVANAPLGATGSAPPPAAPAPGQPPVFSPWDVSNYNPVTGFQLFPTSFDLDATDSPVAGSASPNPGIPPYETFDDLASLLNALSEFIAETGPSGAFASRFVDTTQVSLSAFGDILLDPTQPGLFPRLGRQLAIGVAGAVLQNLVLAPTSHVDTSQTRPVFYPSVDLAGRVSGPVSIASISRAVLAARNFRHALANDPDAPAALTANFSQIDLAIQGIATIFGAQEQCSDGGFNVNYGEGCAGIGGSDDHRLLESTELALRVMMAAYIDYPALRNVLLKLSIRNGWQFMDGFWSSGSDPIPSEALGLTSPQPVDASALWELEGLWNDTYLVSAGEAQPAVRADLTGQVDWPSWDSRAQALRQRLLGQLGTVNGPQPLSP